MQIDEPLHILQEEAAEVIQAISKIYRFGWDSSNPFVNPDKTNRMHLIEEIGDILAVIDIVQKVYNLDENALIEAKNRKFEKLKKWSTIDSWHLVGNEQIIPVERPSSTITVKEAFNFSEETVIVDDFTKTDDSKGTMIEFLPEQLDIFETELTYSSNKETVNLAQELLDTLNKLEVRLPTQEQLDSIKPWYKRVYKWIVTKF
jgi:NTP pyrophosphatase (non-canonical NTP hydrolase)